jgi:hypothetical protein
MSPLTTALVALFPYLAAFDRSADSEPAGRSSGSRSVSLQFGGGVHLRALPGKVIADGDSARRVAPSAQRRGVRSRRRRRCVFFRPADAEPPAALHARRWLSTLPRRSVAAVPMPRGWHLQYITEWLPAFGIRYHVAIDGVSLWFVLLTTFTTPSRRTCRSARQEVTKDLCFAYLLCRSDARGVRGPRHVPLLRVLS